MCWILQLWQAQGCHHCPQGHPILGTVLASLSYWPAAMSWVPPCTPGFSCCWAHPGASPLPRAAGCSTPQGTAWGPTITLLCPQGSHEHPLSTPCPGAGAVPGTRRVTRSLQPWNPGYLPQALAPAYLLERGVLCPVDCPALPQHAQTQLLSCSKGLQRAPVPLNPSHLPGLHHDLVLPLVSELSESRLAQAHGDMAAEIQAPVGWADWCQGAR